MTAFINQYKLLFLFSWIIVYLIFPSWGLPISVNARALVFLGLMIYFCVFAFIMNRWLNVLQVDNPVIVRTRNLGKLIKSNLWIVIVCLIATVLNIYPIFLPMLIIGDEALHLQNGLWVYEYLKSDTHIYFQVAFWVFMCLFVIISRLKRGGVSVAENLKNRFSTYGSTNLLKYCLGFLITAFLLLYFYLFRDMTYYAFLVRYPPLAKILYFLAYSAFGINHVVPRIMQLIFYLLCAVYLYRTICLFYEKETALIGASIYLFLPVTFIYAHLGELISGTLFFIIAISYYFLRFLKEGDNRDLLLSVYLIGTGMLYKKPVFLMFIICFPFLLYYLFKKHRPVSIAHIKVFMLSLVPVLPWMIISKFYSWRNFQFHLANFTSLDSKMISYLTLMSSNVSVVIFIMFLLSVLYVSFCKRNILTVFFGLMFAVYYFFMVADMAALSPRFSMTFYPAVSVFIALFTASMLHYFNWKHAVKLFTCALTAYLIVICTVSPFNKRYLKIMDMKLHYFPSEKAMKWVKDNVRYGEKMLMLRMLPFRFYSYKYTIDKERMIDMPYLINEVSTPEKLAEFYKDNNLSYIMFPYSPAYVGQNIRVGIFKYLQENPNKEFDEVAKFNIDENYIYVYKYKSGLPY